MGVANTQPRNDPTFAERCLVYAMEQQFRREGINERTYKRMNVRVNSEYEVSKMQMIVRVAWSDPAGDMYRTASLKLDEYESKDVGKFALAVENFVSNLNLRGELYFFKLVKHFPKHLKEVKCEKDGSLIIRFKNGQEVRTTETACENADVLATCGMVYDL